MKFLRWNYLKGHFLSFLQGVMLTILISPWLQLLQIPMLKVSAWVFLTILISNSAAQKIMAAKKSVRLWGLALLIPQFLAFAWGLPLAYFLPLNLLLLVSGLRFTDYHRPRRFAADFACGTFFLIITASLEHRLGFQIGLGLVLTYFAAGLTALIFWNGISLEKEGLKPDYSSLGRSISLFISIAALLALALSLLLSPAFLQGSIALLAKVYHLVMDGVVLLIVRPFAWLLSPLFNWADQLEKQIREPEQPLLEELPLEHDFTPEALDPNIIKTAGWGGWVLLVIVLALVVWLIYKKVSSRTRQQTKQLETGESRESVFSRGEIIADLKGALQSIVRPLRFAKRKWYKGDNPLLVIRDLYARFAVRANKKVAYPSTTTPLEYIGCLEQLDLDLEALESLTIFYNLARYGEEGDEEAVKAAQKALQKLKP